MHAAPCGPRWAPRATLAMRKRNDLTAAEPRIAELMAAGGTAASISATLTAEGVVGASRATVGRRMRDMVGTRRHRAPRPRFPSTCRASAPQQCAEGRTVRAERDESVAPVDLPGALALHAALVAAVPARSLDAPGPRPPTTRRSPLALAGFDPMRSGL